MGVSEFRDLVPDREAIAKLGERFPRSRRWRFILDQSLAQRLEVDHALTRKPGEHDLALEIGERRGATSLELLEHVLYANALSDRGCLLSPHQSC